jgi:hypothetical protein
MVAHIEQHGRIPKSAWVRWQRYEGAMRDGIEAINVQRLEALPLWRCASVRILLQALRSLILSIAQAGGRRSGKRSWRMSLSTTRIMGTCRRRARWRPRGSKRSRIALRVARCRGCVHISWPGSPMVELTPKGKCGNGGGGPLAEWSAFLPSALPSEPSAAVAVCHGGACFLQIK